MPKLTVVFADMKGACNYLQYLGTTAEPVKRVVTIEFTKEQAEQLKPRLTGSEAYEEVIFTALELEGV